MPPLNKLTNLFIKNSLSADRPYKLTDDGCLYLLVHPNGSRYWPVGFSLWWQAEAPCLGRLLWDQFDLSVMEWLVPAARMKMRAPHIVSLSRQSLAVLEALRVHTGGYDLLFPSRSNHDQPFSENTMLFALYRMGYHGQATTHGFRALASTILNESSFRPDVIERQLAHSERNKVRAAYHRSEYLEERRSMMNWWGDYLEDTGLIIGP